MPLHDFPISPLLPDILRALDAHPRLVLEAPPGAGKTTQVPLALLDAGWRGDGRILLLEPRRVAARAAAGFMAAQRGEAVGATVGYRIRFEARVSAACWPSSIAATSTLVKPRMRRLASSIACSDSAMRVAL